MSAAAEDLVTDLLVRRATEGLPAADQQLLARTLEAHPEATQDGFEATAAALHVALIGRTRPMPARLRTTVERDAALLFGGPGRALPPPSAEPATRAAWPWLATAAAALIAIAAWLPRADIANVEPSLAVQYAELRAAGALELDWTTTEDPTATGASGKVLWDPTSQSGFMRFVGLAANNPSQFQYQLWIFDAARGEQYPVDGGVFDIPAGAKQVTIPIDPHLPITEATLFAVTVEQPGGVVVSTRERISVIAGV